MVGWTRLVRAGRARFQAWRAAGGGRAWGRLALAVALTLPPAATPAEEAEAPAQGSSFLFVPYPVTEPAIGYGLLAGPVWLREGPKASSGPPKPQATGVGALWTDGGTRGVVAFDRRAWAGGALWSTAAAMDAELVLRYDGLRPGGDAGVALSLDIAGLSIKGERELPGERGVLGLRLFGSSVGLGFDADAPPELAFDASIRRVNGFSLSYLRDRRDDAYSPTSGQRLQLVLTDHASWLGADFDAWSFGARWTHYRAGLGRGVLGLRLAGDLSGGDPPFYLRPYVAIRGVPALRYAGERVFSMELEHRWPVGERWDLLAFAGGGYARSTRGDGEGSATVEAGGVGVRFKARKYFGMTFGLDVAQGPDGVTTYIQIGNAWAR